MKHNKIRVLTALGLAACLLSLSACSSTVQENSGLDLFIEESLISQSVELLEEITEVPEDQLDYLIEQNRKSDQEAVAAGLESYQSYLSDLGPYVSSIGGNVTKYSDGYEITVDAQFEQRQCDFIIDLDEDLLYINSISFEPVYSLGENMSRAAMNTVLGMGTVFIVLIFMSFVISLFKYINIFEEKRKARKSGNKDSDNGQPVQETSATAADASAVTAAGAAAAVAAAAEIPQPAAETVVLDVTAAAEDEDEMEQLAIMAAMIEHTRNNASTDSLVVRPIKRGSGNWKKS